MQRSRDLSYASKKASGESHLCTSRQPPPSAGFMKIGKPRYSKTSFQFTKRMLRNEVAWVPGGCSFGGSRTVFGTATPTESATKLLKNLSSAVHQYGLLMTAVPRAAAHLR